MPRSRRYVRFKRTGLASTATQRSQRRRVRDYILATPDSSGPGSRPLVLLLHGHLGSAANAFGSGLAPSPLSAWLDIVDCEKVLVAALQGLKGPDGSTGWHDCREDSEKNSVEDDVAFATAVVREVVAAGSVRRRYSITRYSQARLRDRLFLL